jgi:hypothetical protein
MIPTTKRFENLFQIFSQLRDKFAQISYVALRLPTGR